MINENTCYQYTKKIESKQNDLDYFNLSRADELNISDLEFEVIDKSNKERIKDIKEFIERYEWLGKINNYWNYAFALTYQGKLVTVVMFGTPTMFSKLLGDETSKIEQVIHRGASCSLAPHNSGSFLIANAISWMVKNTPYRLFYGYSTMHEANEYGYIYQSINAILLTDKAGTRLEYLKPGTQDQWLSDRHLRKLSNYKRIAKKLGYKWQTGWNTKWKIHWDIMPNEIAQALKSEQVEDMKNLTFRKVPPKLKYAIIRGIDKRETKSLIKRFKEHNPKLINKDGSLGLPYPKKDRPCNNKAIIQKEVESERE